MAIVDDSKLIELSAEPVRNLFPIFRRASALKPLVWLLAVLPGVYALQYNTFDLADAFWGVKSLAVVIESDLARILDPALIDPPVPYQWYAPLATWLTALLQMAIGTAHPVGLALVPFLSTAGLIGLTYSLWRMLSGPRFGFLTVVLLAFQANLLRTVQNTAPHALGLMFAVMALWGYLGHLRETKGVTSLKLLYGGIGLGLCLLASGPLALWVVIVLAFHLLSFRGGVGTVRRGPTAGRKTSWNGWAASRSLAILVLMALAVGGWWELMLATQYGWEFWQVWLTGTAYQDVGPELAAAQRKLQATSGALGESLVATFGFLLGLALLGLWRARREALRTTDPLSRACARFLITWSVSATLIWIALVVSNFGEKPLLEVSRLFAMLSYAPLAVFGIEEIARRRVSPGTVAGLAAGTCLIVNWKTVSTAWERGTPTAELGLWAGAALVLAVAVLALYRYCRNRDRRRQVILTGLVVGLIAANSVEGLLAVRRTTDDDRQLAHFRQILCSADVPKNCTLITEQESSIRLEYVLKSIWPDVPLLVVPHWDTALSKMAPSPPGANEVHIVVTWGIPDANLQNIGLNLVPISQPQYFLHRQMRAYTLTAP